MLENILRAESYALALSPGFFQFYALTGVLHGLEDYQCLHPTHVSGSSAGAMVSGFLASGLKPSSMVDLLMNIKREDIWDLGGIGGLLKGQLFQKALEDHLPHQTIEDCNIPLGITAWEIFGFKTKLITSGNLATAIRASCTFPMLFQPVMIDGSLCIDGGVFDTCGLMALPGVPTSNLIVNVVCGVSRLGASKLPEKYKDCRLLTLVMKNIPGVSPFSMNDRGPLAYKVARAATCKALHSSHIQQLAHNHWSCYIDGEGIDPSRTIPPNLPTSAPVVSPSTIIGTRKPLKSTSMSSKSSSKPVVPPEPMAPPTQLKKTPSYTFLNTVAVTGSATTGDGSGGGVNNDNNSSNNLIPLNSYHNSTEITPELDMLLSLCELETNVNESPDNTTTAHRPSNGHAVVYDYTSHTNPDSVTKTKGSKRKIEQVVEPESMQSSRESMIMTTTMAMTDLLMDLCSKVVMVPVPIPANAFDDIHEISREKASEIQAKILKKSFKYSIALIIQITPGQQDGSNHNNYRNDHHKDTKNHVEDIQARKSRRKSLSVYAVREQLIDKWVEAKIIRETTLSERRLGFTHVIHVPFLSNEVDHGDMLVHLSLFGYYDTTKHDQLYPDRLNSVKQETWVALMKKSNRK